MNNKNIKPYINMIKDEDNFKKELSTRLMNLEIGDNLQVFINGEMRFITRESDKKFLVGKE